MADNTNDKSGKKIDYDFAAHERPLFEAWMNAGYFQRTPELGAGKGQPYTIVIPPPNITGVLHMGHALNDTIQDTCIRRARMQGRPTRWILGTDHAGISTQTKVDKKLADQGISRLEIGREAFIEACYDWYKEYGTTIVNQIKGMGCSCDYADEHFTLEPAYVKAVRKLFVDWYHDDLIYKGKRIVNWCPHCTTSISDDEAEYVDETGHLWYLRYPLAEPEDGLEYLVVATTRPETMLGDTGVAVNPKDERFKHLVGKTVKLPLVDREIPIFADWHVDMEFGTGCVKTTPAHDPNDWAMGERNGLERINIFDETAHVVDGFGAFSGMDRDEAREAVVAAFDELGLLDKVEDHDHSVMTCYRCHTKLEPWESEQWFVAVDGLKQDAARVVEDGSIQFHPERWKQVYLDWLANLKDWCISRQLWWGHRIPMFYCDECGADIVTPETIAHISALFREHGSNIWFDKTADELVPEGFVCPKCGKTHFSKESDIMDVWFDSGSTHAAVLDERPYLHFPADVYLEGGDQYRGWFQSSMLTSIAAKGVAPYKQIITHGWTVDGEGRAMHKSLGNAVAPEEVIKDYGADMLRLWVASADYTQDMRISKDIMKQLSQAYLKIRNTARYMLGNLCDFEPDRDLVPAENLMELDRYALHTFNELAKTARAAYDRYEFHAVYRAVYNFCVVDMSNFYLDIIKDRLYCGNEAERRSAQTALYSILDGMTRLIAPILAFTSDEIWHAMKHAKDVDGESVLFNEMPGDNAAYALDEAAKARWEKLVSLRDAVNKALENARNAGVFKKAQDTEITLSVSEADAAFLAGVDLASLCIVSKVTVITEAVEGERNEESLIPCTIAVKLSEAPKCPRCWNHCDSIGTEGHHAELCDRCAAVVEG